MNIHEIFEFNLFSTFLTEIYSHNIQTPIFTQLNKIYFETIF